MTDLSRMFLVSMSLLLISCSASESHRAIEPQILNQVSESGVRPARLAVGKFVNRSTYMNGIFADSGDRLGAQAEQILVTHLSQSRAFRVADRRNMDELTREARINGRKQNLTGAEYVITGAVTEFGRRETGNRGLGGLIHKKKTQTLYGKVSLSVVDVSTSSVLASYQGAGEYSLSNTQVLGFGGTAGYDSTLADKVLNLAMMEAVERLRTGRRHGEW